MVQCMRMDVEWLSRNDAKKQDAEIQRPAGIIHTIN